MTLSQIEETLKLLNLSYLIPKGETKQLPSTLLPDEELCYAFTTYEVKPARTPTTSSYKIYWVCFITQSRIIMLSKDSSDYRTKFISIDKISSLEKSSKILIIHSNGEKTELEMTTAASCHVSYHVINAALNKQDIVDALQNARNTLPKEPMPELLAKLIEKLLAGAMLVGLIFLIKSCFFDPSTEPVKSKAIEKGYKLPSNVSVITENSDTVNLKYTFHKSHAGVYNAPGYHFNVMINDDICKAMQDVASKKTMISNVSVLGVFEDGYFVTTDSYGNSTPVRNIFAFEAVWNVSDIRQYDCEAVPDIWRHATIKNLWMEFRKHIRNDCYKDDNYRKYNTLCSKVM